MYSDVVKILDENNQEVKIREAKRLLEYNGYIVIKETKAMREACDECEAQNGNGDCFGCEANICIYNV